jgi:uncharacterized protein
MKRRHLLGTAAAAVAAPSIARSALPRVAIVGGGMAGVATAWLLDGLAEVTLFEAAPQIGGNVRTVSVSQGGHTWAVDVGAQFFHPGPYPTYVALLTELGLFPDGTGESRRFAATITVDAAGEALPRFVSPALPGRAWPLLAPWNRAGLQAFQRAFSAAARREARGVSWQQSLGDWLPRLGLDAAQWEGMILPWAASLNQGDIETARSLSARSAMVFAAKALPASPLDPVEYHILTRGMLEPMLRMLAATSSVTLRVGEPVLAVSPSGGGFVVESSATSLQADRVVFASSGEPTRALTAGLPGTDERRAALAQMPFYDARLMLHTDPAYVSAEEAWRSFIHCRISGSGAGAACEASMDMKRVLAPGPAGALPTLWKSWVTRRSSLPTDILHDQVFRHVLPSPGAIAAQEVLHSQQGQAGVWIAGGYTLPYDAQETALLSALEVAGGIAPASARRRKLLARRAAPQPGQPTADIGPHADLLRG